MAWEGNESSSLPGIAQIIETNAELGRHECSGGIIRFSMAQIGRGVADPSIWSEWKGQSWDGWNKMGQIPTGPRP